ncbi:MAG: sigma-70 family RNA polymerase sigma factor [Oscillatoria sp. Prado101]|jgi:RNA polymerase sigma factor (sigma-70 family)|nr:sigma-70 family RNA polymerase sigma factor [Oscillatoria sp. Prado101]
MCERQTLIDKFSSFAIVGERNGSLVVSRWVYEPALKRNMQRMVALDPEANENFWALHWLKEAVPVFPLAKLHLSTYQKETFWVLYLSWLKEALRPKWHLSAYLETACYWTAVKICQQFSDKGFNPTDCFQIARDVAGNPAKLFANYDSRLSSVQTYARMRLRSYTLEELRRGREAEKYSDWALLRSLTQTSLEKALENYGFKKLQVDPYRLAWRSFTEIYTPASSEGSRKLQPPSAAQWEAIAGRYNQLRGQLKLEAEVSVEELQNLLKTVVDAVRQSKTSPASAGSLEELDPSMLVPQTLVYNDISEEDSPKFEWERANSILSQSFQSLPEEIRKMLELWLGLDFTQKEVGDLFGWKQDKVSKQMKKHGKVILTQLLKELGKAEGNSKLGKKSKEIDKKGDLMEEWLKHHCQAPYEAFLASSFTKMKISVADAKARLAEVRSSLREELKVYVESRLQISLSQLPQADNRLGAFVRDWSKFLE